MKKAFTMLELVFVIVIVGILSYFVSSSFQRNPLREAADQVVSHIRYTQHLAMIDDKFDPNDARFKSNPNYSASDEISGFGLNEKMEGWKVITFSSDDQIW